VTYLQNIYLGIFNGTLVLASLKYQAIFEISECKIKWAVLNKRENDHQVDMLVSNFHKNLNTNLYFPYPGSF
jgi:hypothetical protein